MVASVGFSFFLWGVAFNLVVLSAGGWREAAGGVALTSALSAGHLFSATVAGTFQLASYNILCAGSSNNLIALVKNQMCIGDLVQSNAPTQACSDPTDARNSCECEGGDSGWRVAGGVALTGDLQFCQAMELNPNVAYTSFQLHVVTVALVCISLMLYASNSEKKNKTRANGNVNVEPAPESDGAAEPDPATDHLLPQEPPARRP